MLHHFSLQSILSTIVRIIIFGGIVQGIFLTLVLTTRRNRNRKSSRMLAVLLAVISLSILHSALISDSAESSYRIKEPLILLIGPLLLFYVKEATGVKVRGAKNLLHVVPFLLFFIAASLQWILGQASAYSEFLFQNSAGVSISMWALIVAQYGFYWFSIVQVIHKNIPAIESEYSSIEGKTLSWLKIFLHVFGILLLLFAATVVFAVVHSSHYSAVDTVVSFGLSCAVFVLGYEGLFQEEIFSSGSAIEAKEVKMKQATNRSRSNVEEEALAKKLAAYFEAEKPFLDETLTLTKLSAQIGIPRNQLSLVINSKFNANFYTFVNTFRVEEAKRLITDPKNKNFTILSLAFQAGFPSKSSFHDIFKKFTGMTPTEYQRKSR
ncbi:MAG: AraC family transcriptional regulator [Bacteroidota bacterium]|nr:AraC family transcriptional regulator [Bacteroidota bacterium]